MFASAEKVWVGGEGAWVRGATSLRPKVLFGLAEVDSGVIECLGAADTSRALNLRDLGAVATVNATAVAAFMVDGTGAAL